MNSYLKFTLSAALAMALTACTNDPSVYSDVHTGISAGVSKRYAVYSGFLVDVSAQAFVAQKAGETRYGIYVNQIAAGMGWAGFNAAYSFGSQLPYVTGGSNVLGCGGGCTTQEVGVIQLTAEQFNQATSTGMEIELVGSGRNVVIKVPATAFQEALMQRPA